MNNFDSIVETTISFAECPGWIQKWCMEDQRNLDTRVHIIKTGELIVNPQVVSSNGRDISDYQYGFKELCRIIQPKTPYGFALCLALYNGQFQDDNSVTKYFGNGRNAYAPVEYADMLSDTNGWVVWDSQFMNILRLFTDDRAEPLRIFKEYKFHGSRESIVPQSWQIQGMPVIESIKRNMLIPPIIHTLHYTYAWPLFRELIQNACERVDQPGGNC